MASWNLADVLNLTGNWPEAKRGWASVVAQYEEVARLEPGNLKARRNVALAHKRLGAVYAKVREFEQALKHYRAALKIDSERVAADPADAEASMDASYDHSDIGWIHGQMGRHREAAESFERALSIREKLAAADPLDYHARTGSARLLMRAAVPYIRLGEPDKARCIPEGARPV